MYGDHISIVSISPYVTFTYIYIPVLTLVELVDALIKYEVNAFVNYDYVIKYYE